MSNETADPLAPPAREERSLHRREKTNTDIAQIYNVSDSPPESVGDAAESEPDQENQDGGMNESPRDEITSGEGKIVAGSAANLCSATLGAGVLSLPFAIHEAGYLGGGLLLFATAVATAISIHILVLATEHSQMNTYEGVVEKCLGYRARQVVELSILLFCGGCAVAYCIAVGDILELSGLMLNVPFAAKELSLLVAWAVAMLPLSMLRSMKSLQCSSAIGIASISTLVFAALIQMIEDHAEPSDHGNGGNSTNTTTIWLSAVPSNSTDNDSSSHSHLFPENGTLSLLKACPIILCAYSCQVNVSAIYYEMPCDARDSQVREGRLPRKFATMAKATLWAVLICSVLYASLPAIVLADTYDVPPNVLQLYAPPKGIMQVATAGMAVAVIMAFPLNIFPARVTVISMLQKRRDRHRHEPNTALTEALLQDVEEDGGDDLPPEGGVETEDAEETVTDSVPFDLKQHVLWTLLLAGSAVGLALIVPNISVVFALLGGTTSSLLGFCVPGALGIQMKRSFATTAVSWILLIGGVVVGIITTGATIYTTMFGL